MLNDFANEVRMHLLAAHPEWESLANEDPDDHGVLLARVPCPTDPTLTLNLFTADDEMTVAFDMWHTHFSLFGQTVAEDVADALALIDDLLCERLAVGVKLADGRWAGSAAVSPEELSEGEDEWSYVRSWQGTHNRGHKPAQPNVAPRQGC